MKYASFFAICMFIFSCSQQDKDQHSHLALDLTQMQAHILKQDGTEIHQYWEFPDEPALWSENVKVGTALQNFRDSLSASLGETALQALLSRELNTHQKPVADVIDPSGNWDIVHSGAAGSVRNINFLEAQLLNYQISKYPLFSHPTEFHGFILRHNPSQKIRVYFAASDQPFPPKPVEIVEEVEKLVQEEWKLIFHLHNHYRDADEGYLGAMGPSMPDAQYFKALRSRFQLEKALITNGFFTTVLDSSELDIFHSH